MGHNQAWLITPERVTVTPKGLLWGGGRASHPHSTHIQSWSQTALFFPRKATEEATYFMDVPIVGGRGQRREARGRACSWCYKAGRAEEPDPMVTCPSKKPGGGGGGREALGSPPTFSSSSFRCLFWISSLASNSRTL